jgi:hypothetical protein
MIFALSLLMNSSIQFFKFFELISLSRTSRRAEEIFILAVLRRIFETRSKLQWIPENSEQSGQF